ncbi:MAG: transposase [Candidatus Poribacteria bacterium]|nr:transposase [Candidatus Poribacteria bacterium]
MATRKTYTPQFKFRLVVECLEGKRADSEVARAHDVHPVTLAAWKKQFLDHGAEVFGGKEEVKKAEKRQAQLERMLGQKELEIALLRNFMGKP